MAETYRKSKVEYYVSRLQLRKNVIKRQIEQEELKDIKDFLRGQLCAIDLIFDELDAEFNLCSAHRSRGNQQMNLEAAKMNMQPQQQPQHHKIKKVKLLRRGFFMTLGASLVSIGLEIFLVPNKIIDGGIVGISIISSALSTISIGVFLLLLNLPFLVLGYKQIGKTFALSTLYSVLIMSIGTTLLHPVPPLTIDPLLAAVFGGIILGIGVGMVIRSGGSLDGTEIIAILLSKKSAFSVGESVMFINVFILASAGFVFGWDHAMYSLIAYYIAFKMIDITIEGFDESKAIWIISERYQDIGDSIMHRLGRGITYLNGQGGFSGDAKQVIFCVITRLEEAKMKTIVEELDPSAFLAVGNIHDVKGGRFKKKNIH